MRPDETALATRSEGAAGGAGVVAVAVFDRGEVRGRGRRGQRGGRGHVRGRGVVGPVRGDDAVVELRGGREVAVGVCGRVRVQGRDQREGHPVGRLLHLEGGLVEGVVRPGQVDPARGDGGGREVGGRRGDGQRGGGGRVRVGRGGGAVVGAH